MNIRKTYWIASLTLLLSFSMLLPVCCGAVGMQSMDHQSEMASHATHGQHSDSDAQSCDCGHELAKDYQKNKKLAESQKLVISSVAVLPSRLKTLLGFDYQSTFSTLQLSILTDSDPPIYLLNSVFLN